MSRNLIWKRRVGRWLAPIQRTQTKRQVILIYHSVGGGGWSTGVNEFESQMRWLSKHAMVLSLEELLQQRKDPTLKGLQVALTFDDGYRTLHDIIAPILKRYDFAATTYINSGHIGIHKHECSNALLGHYPDESFMTWREVHSLASQNWLIGSHGVEHLDLTLLKNDEVLEQIRSSKRHIEDELGVDCKHFSYTWGHHNAAVQHAVQNVGYISAVAGHHQPLKITDDAFSLPRLDIRKEYTVDDFAAILMGYWDYLATYQKIKANLLW